MQIREAIISHTTQQIKDADIAQMFVESAMSELLKFLKKREEKCIAEQDDHSHTEGSGHHEHHTHNEHHKLEDNMEKRLIDTRRVMLNAQKEKRKYKFNQPEYRINRKVMVEKVSKLIHMRITEFMGRILAEDTHCTDSNHRHEDVKENSMLFNELNFGMK